MAQATSEVHLPTLSCLTRSEKESLEVTYEENEKCHQDLAESMQSSAEHDWLFFGLALALGGVVGFAVESSIVHH